MSGLKVIAGFGTPIPELPGIESLSYCLDEGALAGDASIAKRRRRFSAGCITHIASSVKPRDRPKRQRLFCGIQGFRVCDIEQPPEFPIKDRAPVLRHRIAGSRHSSNITENTCIQDSSTRSCTPSWRSSASGSAALGQSGNSQVGWCGGRTSRNRHSPLAPQ